jgi:hypothetical protein
VTVGVVWAAMPVTLVLTTASTFQCGVALGGTANVINGKANYNKWLDDSPIFSLVMTALDIIQIADVAKTLGSGITVKGSAENAYDGINNSLGFIVGFGNNKGN